MKPLIFENPQDPFLTDEFIKCLSNFTKVDYKNNIPNINSKTFFWSTKKFEDIKTQYILDEKINNPKKYFFLKTENYNIISSNYHKKFRNQLKKALSNDLKFEIVFNPSRENIKNCYNIYDANMAKIGTFSFDFNFFASILNISYAYLILIKKEKDILSFGLMLGNFLFLQSSTDVGKKLCSNNLLYDKLFSYFDENSVFTGIASKNNEGLFRFKKQSGQEYIPAKATNFDFTDYIPKKFRHNKFISFILRRIDKKKTLKYVLPY